MVNINIEIPDELHRRLKLDAVLKGLSLKENVIRILSHVLKSRSQSLMPEKIKMKKR